ncbi:MAG: M18 family aminopeptidase [Planctomycetes bacterium]|nr:M18 family aminopeptidase [Planctomycetota bacterium]
MDNRDRARAMLAYIDASPSPFHAVANAAQLLSAAGFVEVDEKRAFPADVQRGWIARGGALLAWSSGERPAAEVGFRVLGAHTDSPNLRIKAKPNTGAAGFRQLGVEVYGGVLLNSWLDRDLSLSGRVVLRASDRQARTRLYKHERALLRIPQLAIHLDREVNTRGLVLDPQLHLAPLWGVGRPDERGLQRFLARELACTAEEILSWDLMLHDVVPATFLGLEGELVCAPRLDNLCSAWCAVQALLDAPASDGPIRVVCLFDHEEVGSTSTRGAQGPLLEYALERLVAARGGTRDDFHRAIAASLCASIDMAHATHPNYREKHEPEHWIHVNAGPVIKLNTNMRYATDAEGEALFQLACERAGVPVQKYFHRSNLACGTTIGPLTAARLGMRTVDVGCAQLSMHSIREMCGADDPALMTRALAAFLAR